MPFHPIALHFHIAVFMVNIIALAVLAILRIFTSPNILEDNEKTRGKNLFQVLDWVVMVTTIIGLILTAIGIYTGFVELVHPPEVATFSFDMFMQIKIYMSFVLIIFYVIPLLARFRYGPLMWKSKGMSVTYVFLIFIGFFYIIVTTVVGSYFTSVMIHGSPVELSQWFLEFLSPTGIFVLFGAIPGNIVANYTVGDTIAFTMIPLITTLVIIVDIILISFIIFYWFRSRQIKHYKDKFNNFKSMMLKGKIDQSNLEFQTFLKEMMAFKVKQTNY